MSRGKKKAFSRKDMDDSFDTFLRESISSEESSIDTARIMKFLDPPSQKTRDKNWWLDDVDEEGDSDPGLKGTGSKFMKKTKPQPAQRSGEKSVSFSQDVGISRDSLDDESLGMRREAEIRGSAPVPALSLGSMGSSQSMTDTMTGIQSKSMGPGKETLDEIADKEKFFKELEKSDDTLDFSRLNRDLDGSNTLAATMEHIEENDETADSEEALSPILTAKRAVSKQSRSSDETGSKASGDRRETDMLSKVALIDSLDSTLGTKLAGSRETRESDDMHPIPEGTREDDVTHEDVRRDTRRAHFEDEDSMDGHRHGDDDTYGNRAMDSRGLTLKGLGTDTSREIEALHSAMRHQVGMETLDDTKNFTLQTHTSTNRTQEMTDGDGNTGFGLKPVALPRQPHDKAVRTADDVLREAQELTGHSIGGATGHSTGGVTGHRHETIDEDNIDGAGGYGFGLSPAHTGGYGMIDTSGTTSDGHDIVPFEKGKKPKVQFMPKDAGSDLSMMTPPRGRSEVRGQGGGYDSPSGSLPVPAKRNNKVEKKSKYSSVKSSGYGNRSPSPKRSTKTSQKSWNPSDIQKQKVKGTESAAKVKKDLDSKGRGQRTGQTTSSLADNHLAQSVQSFANYIQDQFSTFTPSVIPAPSGASTEFTPEDASRQKMTSLDRENKLVREVQEWQDRWQEERRLLAKAKAELSALEREYKSRVDQMRLDKEQEIFKLKQEIYVLSAKITEDSHQRAPIDLESLDDASKEQVALLEREVREQEKLLAGYQQENERLYKDLKQMQGASKDVEAKMFRENQKLNTELANLREMLSQKEQQLKHKGVITAPSIQQQIAAGNTGTAVLGAGRIAQLEAELKQTKSRETAVKLERDTLNQGKQELEQHIVELVHNVEQLEAKITDSKFAETQSNLLKYEKEIDRLKTKLKWYAENQELLDRDADKMRQQEAEILRLKQKLDSATKESGKKTAEVRTKAQERSQDARKIQDLERQVKEMETILRKRHPNSLPVLMWAASNSDNTDDKKAPSVVFLERRILKLELELDAKDDEAKKGLRVVEQKYNTMKCQYEERIAGLEQRLSQDQRPDDRNLKEGDHPHTHATALQRELDSTRERHKKKLAELDDELDKLRRDLVSARSKENAAKASENRTARELESETNLRVKAMQMELTNQEQEKLQLQKTIERLQQEKNQLAVDLTRSLSQANKAQGDKLQNKLQSKTRVMTRGGKKVPGVEVDKPTAPSLPLYTDTQAKDKQYEPLVFAGRHISEILTENDELKQKSEMLQFEVDRQRVTSQRLVAEGEAMTRRSREDQDDKVAALRSAHQAEIQKLLSGQAMQHSTSRVAELQSKLDTQEVVIQHLRDQLSQGSVDRERLSLLTIRETASESQIKQLTEDLREAKLMHTPEMKHFMSLQDKIRDMETRHAQRERELQTIVQHSRSMATADVAEELDKWRRMVDTKNHELERFRLELDSILDVLKELQRQGVVLPYKGPGSGYNSSNR